MHHDSTRTPPNGCGGHHVHVYLVSLIVTSGGEFRQVLESTISIAGATARTVQDPKTAAAGDQVHLESDTFYDIRSGGSPIVL